ncbi:acyl carrier protein [Candidatus Liberibacter solanacearum]|uniref:Acyl carrier protein n=1 Tax=Candidatus Liberibacter solanacearum TaxID=556287 RepID=A0A0F4VHS0_9HYPH|nr:acyl carrier protein [Candidatus Liberibacter solanacearum]KJZ80780.1 acyl carrier protein [Candidatus Liberibacter solanacearum]KJZ81893.1 Acyl carrier protein [Candidatus Liberibacter solanacearum]KQC49654.1 acyl carrier protein [Candidatus Liberibacter solanacearum]ONI58368.1 acyl carrier protein [Candidatus Liberibacter solanacearum]ONI60107.1 acyl carrier protein [Candidatus Liberibacter solanacearum]
MANDNEDVFKSIKAIVIDHLGVKEEQVVESARFIEDLGADSLDTVELVMTFEEKFKLEIPEEVANTIFTVGDAVKFINSAKNKK